MHLIHGLIWMTRIADHIIPIWKQLPQHQRGTLWVRDQYYRPVKTKYPEVKELAPYRSHRGRAELKNNEGPVIVGNELAYKEAKRVGNKAILTTHCCGETLGYPNTVMPAYVMQGKSSPEDVLLFLAPGHHIAEVFKKNNPGTEVRVIGSPKLDRWHNGFIKPDNPKPKVVISFTWNWQDRQWREWAGFIKGAWAYYQKVIPKLKSNDWEIYGNAHPKMQGVAYPFYKSRGIKVMETFEEVLDRADLYICDFSSTIFEFASTDRPVILLNAPWNDKNKQSGLRFWKGAEVGIQVDKPAELKEKIRLALSDPPEVAKKRKEIIDYVYPYRNGNSSKRAARLIQKAFETCPEYQVIRNLERHKIVTVTAQKAVVLGNKYYSRGEKFKIQKERAINLWKKGVITIRE